MDPLHDLRGYMRKNNIDAAMFWDSGEIFCFTRCIAENACAVITSEEVALVAPEGTSCTGACTELLEYSLCGFDRVENPLQSIEAHVSQLTAGMRRIAITRDKLASRHMPDCHAALVDATVWVNAAMAHKPESFLPLFADALALNEKAYSRISKKLLVGMSELELYGIVSDSYLHDCGGPVPFTGDFLSGQRTMEIAGGPIDRVICVGDSVIADTLVARNGAYADTTRTFYMGTPDSLRAKAHSAVVRAIRRGEELLLPGVRCSDVYRAVSASLEADGFPHLPHHAGHGLGYSWYEAPYFIPGCHQELAAGMLVTLEPGIYAPGTGVRLENNYYITPNGAQNLSRCAEDMEYYVL